MPAQEYPGLAGIITIVVPGKAFASRPRCALTPRVTLGHPLRVTGARSPCVQTAADSVRSSWLPPGAGAEGLASRSARANGCFYFHFAVDIVRVKRIEKGVGLWGSRDSAPRNSGFWQFPLASLGMLGRHQMSLLPHLAEHCDIGVV